MSEEERVSQEKKMTQEEILKKYTFPDSLNITIDDTDEVLLDKFQKMYNLFYEFYEEIFGGTDIDFIYKYIDSQVIKNVELFFLQRQNIYHLLNQDAGTVLVEVQNIITYLKSNDKIQYDLVVSNILEEVNTNPFSFTIAVGAGAYQPQFLVPDQEYLNKIHNTYTYNYILSIDSHQQEMGETTLKSSFAMNQESTPFIEKTKRWMKLLLSSEEPVLTRINSHLYSLQIKTTQNKYTKIFFMNGWFFDFNFFNVREIYEKSSYNIFNCSTNIKVCPTILLNKPIFDFFKIVISTMGYSWKEERDIIYLKEFNYSGWIFYVEAYKNNDTNQVRSYEKLVKTILQYNSTPENYNYNFLKENFKAFFFLAQTPFWSQLGGRRRKFKKTRARKSKRNRKTRRH